MNNSTSDPIQGKTPNSESVFTALVPKSFADYALEKTAQLWFLVAVFGQWLFVYYLVVFYLGSALQGNLEAWNNVLPEGYVPGRTTHNISVAIHIGLAIIIMIGGPLQLIPRIRKAAPTFHRWNGRVYLCTIIPTSLVGLFMMWGRGTPGSLIQHLGMSLDAVLIIIFAALTLRYALAGEISTHRRWALRLFMVVTAVWFFRVGLMFWVFINKGPVGFDVKTFQGPFLDFLGFAQYLIPLAVLEIYLRTRDSAGSRGRIVMAASLFVLTIAMGIGIFAASMLMWLPNV